MFTKLDRTEVFRDPIYGYIRVDYKVIHDLIDTREMQRLRRIHQLSGVLEVFPTAEHSRFTHSLGAYECAREILEEVPGACDILEYEQVLLLVTALLHDIGHGPYSHAFETVLKLTHEEIGCLIIENKDTEVNKVLVNAGINPNDITNILLHKGKYPLLEALTSSQIDVDRMDYLARDAYFTGATYGTIDRLRILRSMVIKNNSVFFKSSGVNSLENYIMARYHMYWQVYYHKTAQSYDLLITMLYKRILDLYKKNKCLDLNACDLINVINDNTNIKSYLNLDDGYISGLIKNLLDSKDHILKDFANSIESRKLFKCLIYEENKELCDKILEEYKQYPKYYFVKKKISNVAYLDLHDNPNLNEIRIIKDDNTIDTLENYSKIIEGLIKSGKRKSIRYYYKEPING
ncbi:MAG: HD domain-containing protein [Acholeplasmatales bacterium]|nr:HD domain-containing protein [Acholeplasmatales bacterium]